MAQTRDFFCQTPQRLDMFLSEKLNESRSQIATFIKNGYVSVDGKKVSKPGMKLKPNQSLHVELPSLNQKSKDFTKLLNEAKWLDKVEIIYEDEELLVLNKPSGVVVHDAPSVKEATLVDWLKLKGITLSTISAQERHGIVHRLDKGTSGVMVVAKNNASHEFLSSQLQDKSMGRYYIAIITPPLKEDITCVETNIGRNPSNRLKMANNVKNGKYAKTLFKILANSKDEKTQLIACKLFTGRTHQIRIHLEHISRHIIGDEVYAKGQNKEKTERILLHAYIMYFIHPKTNKKMFFVAKPDGLIDEELKKRFDKEAIDEILQDSYILHSFGTNN